MIKIYKVPAARTKYDKNCTYLLLYYTAKLYYICTFLYVLVVTYLHCTSVLFAAENLNTQFQRLFFKHHIVSMTCL